MPFGVGRTFDPNTILLSALTAYRQQASILAKNLSSRDIPGYVKEDVTMNSLTLGGVSAGVQISAVYQSVDEMLTAQIRDQNSLVGEFEAIEYYFKELGIDMGDPKSQSSFAHLGKAMTDAMGTLAADPTNTGKRQSVVTAISKHVTSIVNFANNIQELRALVDQDLSSTASAANTLLSNIASYNSQLFQLSSLSDASVTFPVIDARRQALHDLSELLDINIVQGDFNQVTVLASSGEILVQGFTPASFTYTQAASVTATSTLSDLTLIGASGTSIVTNTFQDSTHEGKFKALLMLRDQILPGVQQQLDVYTMNLRDALNAIHNQGTSTNPPNTLTGTVGAPGVTGSLTNATVISGAGNLRIAVIDPTTGNVATGTTPVDIALAANTTVGALITSLNTVAAGSFTVSLTSAGQLQISATNASYGVAIGSSGATPTMNAGATVSSSPLGFSHFFGLNNLLQTGTNLLGQANAGISNLLSVRNDILSSSGQTLAIGALSSSTPIGSPAIAVSDSSILSSLVQQMSSPNVVFNSTSVSPQITTSLLNYSNSIINLLGVKIAENKNTLEIAKYTYEGLSTRANEISGVDPRQTIQECIELSTSQNLVIRAMNIMIEMDKALLEIMA